MSTDIGLAMRVLSGALVIAGVATGVGAPALVRRRGRARAWTRVGLPASLIFVLFFLSDWALLWALPRLRLSFSPTIGLTLFATLLLRLAIFWALLGAMLLSSHGRPRQPSGPGARQSSLDQTRWAAALFLVVNLGFSAIQLDAYVVEPLLVDRTELSLTFKDLDPAAPPVRIVHLTDTHIERSSFRERAVIQQVNTLQPDIIVLTGDYLNLSYVSDPTAAEDFRQFIGQLQAPYGIYAVRGSVEPYPEMMARLVEGTNVVWLEQEAVTVDVRGQAVTLVGVACSHQGERDAARLSQAMEGIPTEAFTLLLYHSPDLIAEAVERQVDVYLSGHTHGGQLRLPLYGALVTGSQHGKQYASGLFQEDETTMYVSRGLGFEGGGMPRARFLCRPEIVGIDLMGK